MGLIGAFVGGLLFRVFGLFHRLDAIVISLRDIMAACAGSLLILNSALDLGAVQARVMNGASDPRRG